MWHVSMINKRLMMGVSKSTPAPMEISSGNLDVETTHAQASETQAVPPADVPAPLNSVSLGTARGGEDSNEASDAAPRSHG